MTRQQITFGLWALGAFLIALIITRVLNTRRVLQASLHPNVRAFLMLIRYCEGTAGENGYRMMFTGRLFDDFSKHPNIRNTGGGYTSTAAGAYQFLYSTWVGLQLSLQLPDFSPASQDLGALELIRRRGALEDVIAGRLQAAVKKCAKEWASLPGSPYGQPTKTMWAVEAYYTAAGGKIA